jgi:hypothetical protein
LAVDLHPRKTDWRLCRAVTPDDPVTQQAIAASGLGLEQAPVRSKRLANCRRVHMERTFHDNGAGPDAAHQLVFGDEFTGRLDQDFDDLEGAPANRHRRSKYTKFPALEIDLALT